MTSTALEGKGAGDVALSGVKGFGFGALGGGAGALTSGVRNPVLRFAAQTGTESLLAGGTTYLAGGSRNEIITSAAIGGVSSAATNVARHPIGESAAERRAFEIGHGIRNRTRSFTTAAMIGLDEPALTLRGSGTAPSTEILRRPSVLSGPSVLGGPEPAAHMPVTAPPPKSSPVPASAPSQGAPELPAPVRLPTMQPSAPSGVRARETLDEFLTRGGKIQKLPSESTPEPTITAAPKWKPDTRTVFGEGPEVDAIREASSSRAGIKVVRSKPERGQVRPPLPPGIDAARAEINSFQEPFKDPTALRQQQEILELAKTDAMRAGRLYEDLVAGDFPGGKDVQNKFSRPGRRMDIGTEHEVTMEGGGGGFGPGKLDQLWDDLVDNRHAILTVPKLSAQARDELSRMLAQARQVIGPHVIIVVRETLP